jgi:phage FluMu gp28-like protein
MPAINIYPYQRRWIKDEARFKIGMQARQTGKTFTTTLEIVNDCLEAEAKGRRARWVILSRGERQAKEAIDEGVKKHAQAMQLAIQVLDSEYRSESGVYKTHEVIFPGGSRITALPANPDTARGFSANVFLDEFAFHHDSRKIWAALFPVISAGHKLRVVSTPNGKSNKFYDLMTGKDDNWSRHQTDIYQAVADGLRRDVAELKAALGDPDAWAQEYELQWLDEASAWLSYDLINGVEHDQAGLPELYQGGPVFMGLDIARRNDLWVLWAAELVGDVLWTRLVEARRRISFAEQDAIVAEAFKRYRVARLCVDQTGMGEKVVEDYQRQYGAGRVEGVLFSTTSKLELANAAKSRFEDRLIRVPMDTAIRADLHSLKKEQTASGAPRFVADGTGDGHADRAWACFLACYAAGHDRPVDPNFMSAGRRIGADNASTSTAGGVLGWLGRGFGSLRGRNDFRGH